MLIRFTMVPSSSIWLGVKQRKVNQQLPAVVGEIQKKLDQSIVWREKHLCQILFEFYHGQTFDDEVKKLDGGEYLPIIYKYINLLTDNYRDWKGHLIDWWSIQNVLSVNNGVIYNHTNTFFQPFFLCLKANWYLDAHNGNAMLQECRYVNFISSINGGK